MSREVVVVSGVRTAIGTYGGSLKDIAPTDLAAQPLRFISTTVGDLPRVHLNQPQSLKEL